MPTENLTGEAEHSRSFFYWVQSTYEDVREAFLMDEWFAHLVGAKQLDAPVLHVWRHQGAIVLGIREKELPAVRNAVERFEQKGIQVMSRTSGGAAVWLDDGVVNVSVIWPGPPGQLSLNADFENFAAMLDATLPPIGRAQFKRGEVKGSYCPGTYDLSLDGKKICGLAQRRPLRSRIWQAFVNVSDVGSNRAGMVAQFYATAGAEDLANSIASNTVSNLSVLLERKINAISWIELFKDVTENNSKIQPLEKQWLQIPNDDQWIAWREQWLDRYRV